MWDVGAEVRLLRGEGEGEEEEVVRAVISSLSFPTDAETEGESRYAVASPDRMATGSRGDTRRRLLEDVAEEVEYALLRKVEPGRCDKREGPLRAVVRNTAPVLRRVILRLKGPWGLDGRQEERRVVTSDRPGDLYTMHVAVTSLCSGKKYRIGRTSWTPLGGRDCRCHPKSLMAQAAVPKTNHHAVEAE
jgi:hypothetical protein